MSINVVVAFLLLLAGGCQSTGRSDVAFDNDRAEIRILFIGNSLTYVNDVPGMVAAFAAGDGRSVAVASVAVPDASLQDHWEGGAPDEIRRLRADFVVMQQGPSSLPASRADLLYWATRFAAVIREAGGEPALYMVWPDAGRAFAFADVERSYAEAARAVQGRLLPAGSAWLEARRLDPTMQLYGSDGFHPATLGSVTAALAIYAGLFDLAAADLPAAYPGVAPDAMSRLRTAVSASLERWRNQ